MPSRARSSLIITSIAATARVRNSTSHSHSGACANLSPNSCASACADRDQIVARIKPFRDLADRLAKRLAIPQMRRAGEDIDLPAGIVDIIFADHLVPGEFQQGRQRIADHRAPAMAHVHRPGRVGGDIFDVDRAAAAHAGTAVIGAQRREGAQFVQPGAVGNAQIDEARPGDLGAGDLRQASPVRPPALRPARAGSSPQAWPAPWRHWSTDRRGWHRAAARP